MNKKYLTFILISVFLLLLGGIAQAAIPDRVTVGLTEGTNDSSTKITLSWTGYEVGDVLDRSLDGSSWSPVVISANGGQAQYIEDNFPNWQLVYFKVSSGSDSKRVNVYPPIENGHANYADDTNQCKLCHITHTAEGKSLMAQSSIKELCYTCHGGAATGSRYNVEQGTVMSGGTMNWGDKTITVPTYRRALGGAFTGGGQSWNNLSSTSTHDVLNENQIQLAPGGGGNMTLSCISCHNAHSSDNNYRMLNDFDNTISVNAFAYYNTTASSINDFQEIGNYLDNGLNSFCSKCHSDYQVGAGGGYTTEESVYRHATDVPLTWEGDTLTTTLPVFTQGVGGEQRIFCGTCHYAHGTTVEGTNLKEDGTESTVLKRLDNMGVCENCHKK